MLQDVASPRRKWLGNETRGVMENETGIGNASGLEQEESSWLSSVEYAVLDWASILVPPPFIATGLVGNPLAHTQCHSQGGST